MDNASSAAGLALGVATGLTEHLAAHVVKWRRGFAVELRNQDATLRVAFIESCKRFGLVVVGYSGRDASVMTALEEAVAVPGSFPAGLFWITRTGAPVYERVTILG